VHHSTAQNLRQCILCFGMPLPAMSLLNSGWILERRLSLTKVQDHRLGMRNGYSKTAQRHDLGSASFPHAAPLDSATPHEVNAPHQVGMPAKCYVVSRSPAITLGMQRTSVRVSRRLKRHPGPRTGQAPRLSSILRCGSDDGQPSRSSHILSRFHISFGTWGEAHRLISQ
jgi:hypothetical protein